MKIGNGPQPRGDARQRLKASQWRTRKQRLEAIGKEREREQRLKAVRDKASSSPPIPQRVVTPPRVVPVQPLLARDCDYLCRGLVAGLEEHYACFYFISFLIRMSSLRFEYVPHSHFYFSIL